MTARIQCVLTVVAVHQRLLVPPAESHSAGVSALNQMFAEIGFALPAAPATAWATAAATQSRHCRRCLQPRPQIVCGADSLTSGEEQASFISGQAATSPPRALEALLFALTSRGDSLLSPAAHRAQVDTHPFLIPLSHRPQDNGAVTGLLRWPTPSAGMQLPVVSSIPNTQQGNSDMAATHFQLSLLAPSTDAFINRELAHADQAHNEHLMSSLFERLPDAAQDDDSTPPYYMPGSFHALGLTMPQFLTLKVARYPDAYEQLTLAHQKKGDTQSALVTCETSCDHFHGWASPHVFHALFLQTLGRDLEMRDAARFALQMPLWTVGKIAVQELAQMAGYKDPTSLGKIYKQLSEDIRQTEIAEGKAPQQVALDRAAYLLDYAVAENTVTTWGEVTDQLAHLYQEGMMPEIAAFIKS